MILTSNIKKGIYIILNNNFYKIIDFLHVKPGKGNAFIRTKLKNIKNGSILENTFPSGHKIKEIFIQNHIYIYIYKNKLEYYFMNIKNYNQISFNKKKIKDKIKFLKEGIKVNIAFKKGSEEPISLSLPPNVILKVSYTEPGIKGDTVKNSTKLAKLETGLVIQVPLFIKKGEYIKVNTENGLYLERIKK